MTVVALIPARGGSKGIPRKNLRELRGVPLIVHSIRAARGASSVDEVFVSTEDDEIAAVAGSNGATVIRRPPELATDQAQNDAVAVHMLQEVSAAGLDPSVLVLLQPTSPLRSAADIDGCMALFRSSGARSAMTICEVEHHPGKCVRLNGRFIDPYTCEQDMEARRQELPTVYRQNGAVYVVGVPEFLERRRFFIPPSVGYTMSRQTSIDIDEEVDLQLAELVARSLIV